MERILAIRLMEEEQSRRLLELALAELLKLERGLSDAKLRERAGRGLVWASAASGEILDRIAGLEETRSAISRASALVIRIRKAEERVILLRQDYLGRRTARLQAETLADEENAQQARIGIRKNQQALDDWYLNRRQSDENSK